MFEGNNRLSKVVADNLKNMLKWLKYNYKNSQIFQFVGTHAESLTDDVKRKLYQDAKDAFGILQKGVDIDPLIYVGFPPEINYETSDKFRKDFDNLKKILVCKRSSVSINVVPSSCVIL